MIGIAISLLIGLVVGGLQGQLSIRLILGVSCVGTLLAGLKWMVLQGQSDLFVPSASLIPIWMAEMVGFAVLGLFVGRAIRHQLRRPDVDEADE